MRNLKRALSLALASVMLLGMMVVGTSAAGYPDVDAQDNLEAIEVMQLLGVMAGDENGNFNPDKNVTRNEMAVIMSHLLKLNVGGTTPFTDVPAWAQPYVAACYANGVVAGTSATTFGGNDSVTATQAALMVMKALGYFQFQGEFKNDWQLAVVTQATKIDLFDGIKAQVNAPLTRNEVAQLCLNALEADVVVVEEQGGISVSGENMNVVVNGTYKYEKVANSTADKIQQLSEKLFDKKLSKVNTTDAFGRPAVKWTYAGKDVTAAKAADATYTGEVKGKTIYADLGLSTADTKVVATVVDGDDTVVANKTIGKNDTTNVWGGNGVKVEVYTADTDNDGVIDVITAVEIKTYASKVNKVVAAKGDDEAYVTVTGETGKYETEAFEKDDVVLYTKANGVIKTMTYAEMVESGKVVGLNATKNTFTIGSTVYKYNATVAKADYVAIKDEVKVYVDAEGFVVYTDVVDAADPDYAYVMGTKNEGGFSDGSGTNYAKLLLADGTIVEVKAKLSDDVKTALGSTIGVIDGKLVTYTVKDGTYTIKTAVAGTPVTQITKGAAKLAAGLVADAKTIFVVRTGKTNDWTYTAYTGIKNVPTMSNVGTTVAYAEKGVAKFVYVTNAEEKGTEASKPIFVLASSESEYADEDGTYYVYNAVVDGAVTEVTSEIKLATKLYKSATYNSDNRITAVSALEAEKQGTGVGTDKAKNELVTLAGAKYAYSDSVQVFVIDSDDEITESSIGSIGADDDDVVIFSFTNKTDNIVNAIYIIEK